MVDEKAKLMAKSVYLLVVSIYLVIYLVPPSLPTTYYLPPPLYTPPHPAPSLLIHQKEKEKHMQIGKIGKKEMACGDLLSL